MQHLDLCEHLALLPRDEITSETSSGPRLQRGRCLADVFDGRWEILVPTAPHVEAFQNSPIAALF